MQSNYKMNIEEIKQLLREEQIRELIKWSTCTYAGDLVSLEPIGHAEMYCSIGFSRFYKRSGWSRTTFKKRWDTLVLAGFITRERDLDTCYGKIESKQWRHHVEKLIQESLISQGLSNKLTPMNRFDLDKVNSNVFVEVLNALTSMGN